MKLAIVFIALTLVGCSYLEPIRIAHEDQNVTIYESCGWVIPIPIRRCERRIVQKSKTENINVDANINSTQAKK